MHSQHFHDFNEGVTGNVPYFLKSVSQKRADFQKNAGNKDTTLFISKQSKTSYTAKEAPFQAFSQPQLYS